MVKKESKSKSSRSGATKVKSAIQRPTDRKKRVKKEPGDEHTTSSSGVKGKRRFRPGTQSVREIRRLQKTSKSCFRKLGFRRLIDECKEEVQTNYKFPSLRVSDAATNALIAASENFITNKTRAAYQITRGMNRVTLKPDHLQLANTIQSVCGF